VYVLRKVFMIVEQIMDNWLYFQIFGGNKKVIVCCIKASIPKPEELIELDNFLAYYGQNYRMRTSMFEEAADVYCGNMKEIRASIIDANRKING
jgi:hypothetical protein